jgi:predicted transglutaminase-like cysteine proteinase
MRLSLPLSAIIAALLFSAPAAAIPLFQETPSKAVLTGSYTPAPFGFIELCVRDSRVCSKVPARRVETHRNGAVVHSAARIEELIAVDRAVDRGIRPRRDRSINGYADRWQIGAREGDCEEYALEKRQRLLEMGWPSSSLLIAIGRIRGGEQHAVLLARVGNHVVVLDNLRSRPAEFGKAGIKWLAVQSPDNPQRWRSLRAG